MAIDKVPYKRKSRAPVDYTPEERAAMKRRMEKVWEQQGLIHPFIRGRWRSTQDNKKEHWGGWMLPLTGGDDEGTDV